MTKRTVAAAALGLVLACAANAQVEPAPSETDWERLFATEDVALAILISPERIDPATGTARLHVRLLDVATGEIAWAGSFEPERLSLERLSLERSAQRPADSRLDELALRIVAALTGHVEPTVVHGDADGDGIPDYLNRRANPADHNRDGLPDYLNRYFLQRRPL